MDHLAERAPLFWMFQKGQPADEPATRGTEADETTTDFDKIRCPACQWHPRASSLWGCVDCGAPEYFSGGCGTAWNTFTTQGRCPGCAYQWRWTQCLRCGQWSPHEAWYTD